MRAPIPAAPGKYCWRVNYSGDGFYQQASHTNASSECFVVVPECDIYYEYQSSNPLTNLEFNENEVLRAFRPNIAFKDGTVQMFYNDEHTLTLGISQVSVKTAGGTTVTNCALSAFPGASPPCDPVPGVNGGFACHVVNPDVGTTANPSNPADDATCVQNNVDPSGRPLYPALFITDLTQNGPTACSPTWQSAPPAGTFCGDWQFARRGANAGRRVRDVEGRDDSGGQDEGSDGGDLHEGGGHEARTTTSWARAPTRCRSA